ncbi:MAG: hypothetical protein JO106_08040 [Mycobacterium sp.]|nr:hypothetical protein [Mycobacterium sp.]
MKNVKPCGPRDSIRTIPRPAELMARAVTVPADTVPQADDLLHELVARERFEIVVHRRHASSRVTADASAAGRPRAFSGTVRSIGPVEELLDERGQLTGS